jgi:hypothetical protein
MTSPQEIPDFSKLKLFYNSDRRRLFLFNFYSYECILSLYFKIGRMVMGVKVYKKKCDRILKFVLNFSI